jgi:hypothetical protein
MERFTEYRRHLCSNLNTKYMFLYLNQKIAIVFLCGLHDAHLLPGELGHLMYLINITLTNVD